MAVWLRAEAMAHTVRVRAPVMSAIAATAAAPVVVQSAEFDGCS